MVLFFGGKVPLCIRFQLGNSLGIHRCFFFGKVLECKTINKAQMVDFLTKPFQKMPKNNRAKGVALKSPDIKIVMYVCTPLNKVFGFQGSKILVVN